MKIASEDSMRERRRWWSSEEDIVCFRIICFCWEFPAANGRRAFSRSSLMRFTIQLTDL